MGDYRIGMDVGGTKIAYGLFDRGNHLVYRYKTLVDPLWTKLAFTETVTADIREVLAANQLCLQDIDGIAIGMPSYVDFEKGIVVSTSNIVNLNSFHAKDALSEKLPGVKIIIDNDTNLAALAEHRMGSGQGHRHMLYTTLGTGVGSGFIIDNRLFRGAYGGAGESGHMIITPGEGVLCGCGNRGCFMSYTSGSMIRRHILEAIERGEKTCMTDMVENARDISVITLVKAYREGDALAGRMVDQMGYYIGLYVYNMFIALNFNCYVFGGGLVNMGDLLFDRIRDTMGRYNHQAGQEIQLKTAALGDDCGMIGAAMLLEDCD